MFEPSVVERAQAEEVKRRAHALVAHPVSSRDQSLREAVAGCLRAGISEADARAELLPAYEQAGCLPRRGSGEVFEALWAEAEWRRMWRVREATRSQRGA